MKTNVASPAFEAFTSYEVKARREEIAANNTNDQSLFGGEYHVRVSDISVDGDAARVTTCDDYRQVTVVEPGGPLTLEELGMVEPLLMEITLARNSASEGLWIIQTSEKVGTC